MAHTSFRRLGAVVALLLAATAFAETERERLAREDVERQLKLLVGTPPTKIRVDWVGLDQPQYKIVEASFTLDGKSLPTPSKLSDLDGEGDHLIFFGDVSAGKHVVESKITIENTATQLVSSEGGYQWKVGSTVAFETAAGLEVDVKITPKFDPKQAELKRKFSVSSPTQIKMLAKLDDGSLPPPPPAFVAAVEADAGVADAEVVKPRTAAEKAAELAAAKKKAKEEADAKKKADADAKKAAQLAAAEEAKAKRLAAAEAAKQKAEDAKAAKLAAAETAKQKAEDAKAAKLAAAEAAKQKIADDKAAKLAAADAAKQKAEDEKATKLAADAEAARLRELELAAKKQAATAHTEPLVQPDAGSIAAVEADAGEAVAVAEVTPPPPLAPVKVEPAVVAPPVTQSETPWLLYAVPAIAVIGLLLFVLTRKKKQP